MSLPAFDAVTLDVGGVFVVPHHRVLLDTLGAAALDVDADRFWDGHYRAMHAVDTAQSPAETFSSYVHAFCHHVGLRGTDFDAAVAALQPLFGPAQLWSQPIPDSVTAVRALHHAGLPLAVVSNSDGTVDRVLREVGVCQCGPGPLVPVAAIVDSGVVGVAKPDPAIFAPALEALETDPARTLHVGDSVHFDVNGARAAGMPAAHFDPRRLCPRSDHPHVRSLYELLR